MKYTVLLTDGRSFAIEASGYSYSSPYLCLHDAEGKVMVGVRDPVLVSPRRPTAAGAGSGNQASRCRIQAPAPGAPLLGLLAHIRAGCKARWRSCYNCEP